MWYRFQFTYKMTGLGTLDDLALPSASVVGLDMFSFPEPPFSHLEKWENNP
jgi:hypothetical protein